MPVTNTTTELLQLGVSIERQELVDPTYDELVDRFENIWIDLTFKPVEHLFKIPNSEPAVISLLCPYYEAYAGLKNGINTNGRSGSCFLEGFRDVFPSVDHFGNSSEALDAVINYVYKYARCGLAHEGVLNHRIFYPLDFNNSVFCIYKKDSGGAIASSSENPIDCIVLGTKEIYISTRDHFSSFVKQLKSKTDTNLCDNFEKAFRPMVGC